MGNTVSRKNKNYQEVENFITPTTTETRPPLRPTIDNVQLATPTVTPSEDSFFNFSETPKLLKSHHIMSLIDPRSPTEEISRTPVLIEEEQTRREQAQARLAKLKENITPSTGALPFDPRSPTDDFNRTPIRFAQGQNGRDFNKFK